MRKVASMCAAVLLVGGVLAGVVRAQVGSSPPVRSGSFAKPSSPIEFYRSEKGRQVLSHSSNAAARAALKAFGTDAPGLPQPSAVGPRTSASQGHATPADAGTVSSSCGTSFGTKFNLEPPANAFPQNEQAVDFKRNGVASGVDLVVGASNELFQPRIPYSFTGYYVNRDSDCAPEFEGGTPPISDPLGTGDLFGLGDPVVAADPVRNAYFVADIHLDDTTTAIGVIRSTTATLLSTGSCPNGTHDDADSLTCWPTGEAVLARLFTPDELDLDLVDKPHLAVDERNTGTGAGQVYVVATDFDPSGGATSVIKLVACSNDLQTCSAPLVVSGTDTDTQFPHITIRPSGALGITWVSYASFPNVQIKYQSCTVATVPTAPSCPPSLASLVRTETRPLLGFGALLGQDFRVDTYPKVDVRSDSNGVEMYVVWDRCQVALIDDFVCPDSDILMKASSDNGGTWSAATSVHTGSNHQFFPWIDTDRSRNIVNIIYLTSLSDSTFQHRVKVGLQHINPGGSTPDPITDGHTMASLLNDPSGDWLFGGFFYGDYIGVAARGTGSDGGSRAYGHFTYNNLQGTYSGVSAPNQNNHLSRLDY